MFAVIVELVEWEEWEECEELEAVECDVAVVTVGDALALAGT